MLLLDMLANLKKFFNLTLEHKDLLKYWSNGMSILVCKESKLRFLSYYYVIQHTLSLKGYKAQYFLFFTETG